MPGDGEPDRSPNVGGAPTAIPGSSSGTTRTDGSGFTAVRYDTPRPMYSSSGIRLTADQAAAIMGQHQPARPTYLGPSNPGPTVNNGVTAPTGQFTWPALQTNPQLTVNSTISSPATPAIISGAGGSDGGAAEIFASNVSGFTGASTVTNGTSAGFGIGTTTATAGTSAANTSAPIFSNNATTLTPANAAIPLTTGAFAAGPSPAGATLISPISGANTGALTPTVSSANVATPTTTLNPAFATQQANVRLGTSTNPIIGTGTTVGTGTSSVGSSIGTATSANATTRAASLRTVGAGTGNVRVINTNGRVTITNVNSSTNGENPQR